jgi:hypothetical protein
VYQTRSLRTKFQLAPTRDKYYLPFVRSLIKVSCFLLLFLLLSLGKQNRSWKDDTRGNLHGTPLVLFPMMNSLDQSHPLCLASKSTILCECTPDHILTEWLSQFCLPTRVHYVFLPSCDFLIQNHRSDFVSTDCYLPRGKFNERFAKSGTILVCLPPGQTCPALTHPQQPWAAR